VVPEVWGNVPQRNKYFTGRSALLDELRERLTTHATARVPCALHGLGGVGKTQLAIEYAYRYASSYQVVWWIPADQTALVRASLAALAPRLGITGLVPGRVEDALAAVLDALRRGQPYERWLLVFDNADQPDSIREFIPMGPGDVIVTSRDRSWAQVAEALEVDVFTSEESRRFLTSRVPQITDADADRLAEGFGDLPLGLEQAAAWLAQTAMTVDAYLNLLTEEASRVLAENPAPSDYPLPVAAAWSLSVARLRTQTPYAMELLQCCAFFGPAPIPLEVLERGRYLLGSPLQGTLNDPILLGRAIRALGRYALARIDNYRRTIEVHRIIQRLIREELDNETRSQIRHDVHMLLAAADPGDPEEIENWPRYSALLAHIDSSGVVVCTTPDVRRLAQNIVRYLYMSGNYSSAISLADRALVQWTRDSGIDELYVLVMTRLKIQVLQALARYDEAYNLTDEVLDRMRAALGEDHEETLILMNCHCINLRARGDFAASLEFTATSRDRHLKVFGSDHPRTFAAMNNYAEDLELNGSYAAARQLHEQIYEEKLVVYGHDNHPRVLYTLGALGRIALAQGRYTPAHELAERAYDGYEGLVREHVLTENHPWVLQQALNLSTASCAAGAFAEGRALADETYRLFRRTYSSAEHPGTLAAAASLGNAERLIGNLEPAAEILEETWQRYESVFGFGHPYALDCAVDLAITRRRGSDLESARRLLERAIDGLRQRLGPQHHHVLICVINLAATLAELGDIKQAAQRGEDVLPDLVALLGADHPHTLACAMNLSLDWTSIGQEQRGTDLADETIRRYRNALGNDHPDVKAAAEGKRLDVGIELHPTF
jgi:tetratricopeptide (TPR) repeat protein